MNGALMEQLLLAAGYSDMGCVELLRSGLASHVLMCLWVSPVGFVRCQVRPSLAS